MKKNIVILNSLLIILVMIFDVCYMKFGTLWLKATASLLFVLMGAVNLYFAFKLSSTEKKFSIVLFIGLIFAMLGDIVLNLQFILGALLFAIGHIFFFISYSYLIKFKPTDLIYGAAIFLPSLLFIVLAPIFDFGGVLMEIVCVVYALIISFMVGKSISNLVTRKSVLTLIIFLGSLLFFISDLMLLLNVFGGLPKIVDYICLITYYPAEILLALSVVLATRHD